MKLRIKRKLIREHKNIRSVCKSIYCLKRGFIDDVIRPHSTRRRIATALENLKDKELSSPLKKHDNIPL